MNPYDLNISYEPASAEDGDSFLTFPGHQVLGAFRASGLVLPTVGEARASGILPADAPLTFLFSMGDRRFFTARDLDCPALPGYEPLASRTVRHAYPRDTAFAASLGSMIANWYDRTRFCGRCGHENVHDARERMMYCPACGSMYYPQICPSIIVAILHEGKLLVTRYNPEHKMIGNGKVEKPTPHYALVAGYIESGESAEEAVVREVWEEVGLNVRNIRYYSSQPWPFTSALLLGYVCEVDGDPAVRLSDGELTEAEFKAPEELTDRSCEIALTSRMIEAFRTGKLR